MFNTYNQAAAMLFTMVTVVNYVIVCCSSVILQNVVSLFTYNSTLRRYSFEKDYG